MRPRQSSRVLMLVSVACTELVACQDSKSDPMVGTGVWESGATQGDGTESTGSDTSDSVGSTGLGSAGMETSISSSAGTGDTDLEGEGDTMAPGSDGGASSGADSTDSGGTTGDAGLGPCPEALDAELMAEIQPYVDYVEATAPGMISNIVPAISLAVVGNGEVAWAKAYGQADKELAVPASADGTVFQVASLSKSVTAWGVMKAVEMGLLDLDAPVQQYLTRWQLPPTLFDNAQVTARRLLSHTGGTSVPGYGGYLGEPVPSLEESLISYDGGVRVVNAPGTTFTYSGGGFTVLQLVLEEVTGETFTEFMDREILAALGMEHSSFAWLDEIEPMTAKAYGEAGELWPNYLFTEKAAAGLYVTANALATFAAAGMGNKCGAPPGRGVLAPESVDAMHTPQPATMDGYGLGHAIDLAGVKILFHNGANLGWRAVWVAVPSMQGGVVAMTNAESSAASDALTDLVCEWLGQIAKISCA